MVGKSECVVVVVLVVVFQGSADSAHLREEERDRKDNYRDRQTLRQTNIETDRPQENIWANLVVI